MMVSLTALESILRAEDMEGLQAVGAPGDEYNDEAAAMQAALEQLRDDQVTQDNVAEGLMSVWERSFGPFSEDDVRRRQPVLQRLAERVLEEGQVANGVVKGPAGMPVPAALQRRFLP